MYRTSIGRIVLSGDPVAFNAAFPGSPQIVRLLRGRTPSPPTHTHRFAEFTMTVVILRGTMIEFNYLSRIPNEPPRTINPSGYTLSFIPANVTGPHKQTGRFGLGGTGRVMEDFP